MVTNDHSGLVRIKPIATVTKLPNKGIQANSPAQAPYFDTYVRPRSSFSGLTLAYFTIH